jgi:two-component system, NarL family, invasion response regulator UvrY
MTRVLIADDHAIVRKGLRQILSEADEAYFVDEASNGGEAIRKALADAYDLVLMDISMPGRGGLDALKEIKANRPALPVLILSIHPEAQYALRAFRSGASGYLSKESAADALLGAIRKVLSGGRYVSASLAELLVRELGPGQGETPRQSLSDREDQVLRLLAGGKTVKEIAAELSLSAKTIGTYRFRLLKKLNIRNNAELIQYAFRNGLAD